MPREVRVLSSESLTAAERERLVKDVTAILARHAATLKQRGIAVSTSNRAALLDALAHASARAKPVIDLSARDASTKVAIRKTLADKAARNEPVTAELSALARRHSPSRKQQRLSLHRRDAASMRGRPASTWQNNLLGDVRDALAAAGLPHGFKTDRETLLTDILRACAECTAATVPADKRDLWRNAQSIRRL